MGNTASRARKLNQIPAATTVARTSQARLPTQALKEQFARGPEKAQQSTEGLSDTKQSSKAPENTPGAHSLASTALPSNVPEGRDGMDPSADAAFINSINQLGRQIKSYTAQNTGQMDVRALKQLINRKRLYSEGQKEVEAQMSAEATRTMLHPRTLTAVLNAVRDGTTLPAEIAKDYQVEPGFLDHMARFRVADRIVVIEEQTKEDEIGPKASQPPVLMMDYEGAMGEEANNGRLNELRKRLE